MLRDGGKHGCVCELIVQVHEIVELFHERKRLQIQVLLGVNGLQLLDVQVNRVVKVLLAQIRTQDVVDVLDHLGLRGRVDQLIGSKIEFIISLVIF
jgi:hypothetical protein